MGLPFKGRLCFHRLDKDHTILNDGDPGHQNHGRFLVYSDHSGQQPGLLND